MSQHVNKGMNDCVFVQMLHVGRTKGPSAECKPGKTLLADLKRRHAFYATPTGSNDDW